MNLDAGSLFASLAISSVGFGIFLYGKKQKRLPHLLAGVALMAYPYFVPGVLPMIAIAVVVVAALWFVASRDLF
ncbi:MAG TPA: hypothetical protein VFF73_32320 [Planctomycetota bacterium]|nr:hypothetical protein [Planctomycetota bacterium]